MFLEGISQPFILFFIDWYQLYKAQSTGDLSAVLSVSCNRWRFQLSNVIKRLKSTNTFIKVIFSSSHPANLSRHHCKFCRGKTWQEQNVPRQGAGTQILSQCCSCQSPSTSQQPPSTSQQHCHNIAVTSRDCSRSP